MDANPTTRRTTALRRSHSFTATFLAVLALCSISGIGEGAAAAVLPAPSAGPAQPWQTGDAGGNGQVRRVTYEADVMGEGPAKEIAQAVITGRLGVTSEAARMGRAAGVATLLPDDPQYRGNLGYRTEWQSEFRAQRGGEYWYGASYYLPVDWNQGRNTQTFDDRIVFQFHEGSGKPPTFSLHVDAAEELIVVRRRDHEGTFHYLWSAPLREQEWYDFAFRARWTNDDDGLFEVYLDGRLVNRYRGRTLTGGADVYTKWGVYGQPTRILFDEIRIAEGANGHRAASAAHLAVLLGELPVRGVGLLTFSGGTTDDLAAAAACRGARFWSAAEGAFIGYISGAPEWVNAAWEQLFPDGVPEDTPLLGSCGT